MRKIKPQPAISQVAGRGQYAHEERIVDPRPEQAAIMSERDRPNLIVFPPLLLLSTIVLGFVLQWLVPLNLLVRFDQTWRTAVGGGLFVVGVVLTQIGARVLLSCGTNVNPLRPAVSLATGGIYRWTRNPMYLGGGPLMVGIAIVFAIDWLLLIMVPSGLILHFGIVRREEAYLERKFGEEYRRYRALAPRYFGFALSDHHQEN
jgi:protein-S-isoprenylcysteine O-methyltransferase Ste14